MNFLSYFLPIYPSYWFFGTLFLMTGILLQSQIPDGTSFYFFIATTFLLLIFGCFQKNKLKTLFIGAYIVGAGSFLTHVYFLQKYLPPLHEVSVQGVIREKAETGNPFWPYKITLKITHRENVPCQPIFVFIYTKKDAFLRRDDIIKIKNITVNYPTEKDFWLYLARQKVSGTAFICQSTTLEKIESPSSCMKTLETIQEDLLKKLRKKMPRKTFAFFSSLFIGDKNRVKSIIDQQKDPFKIWGLSHQLARSGLHLLLFIVAWTFLISFLPLPFWIKTSILIIISCCYWLLTPMSISFLRAFAVFMFYKICNVCSFSIYPLHLLSLVCFFTLLYNPFHLFFLDFQLSFFLAFCLIWLSQINLQRKILLTK